MYRFTLTRRLALIAAVCLLGLLLLLFLLGVEIGRQMTASASLPAASMTPGGALPGHIEPPEIPRAPEPTPSSVAPR